MNQFHSGLTFGYQRQGAQITSGVKGESSSGTSTETLPGSFLMKGKHAGRRN